MIPDKYSRYQSFTAEDLIRVLGSLVVNDLIAEARLDWYETRSGISRVTRPALERALCKKDPVKDCENSYRKILIVDDDPAVHSSLKRLISKLFPCVDVYFTDNAFEAGQLSEELLPDILMLDINMPGMDGIETCRIFKQNNPDIKIIGISGHSDLVSDILLAGADCFLAKPVESGTLLETIKQFL